MNKKNIVGILWMIVHVICASVLSSYARMLYKSFHPFYISLFFNFSAFLIALPLIIVNRKQLIKSCFISLHALRGALYTFAQLIFVFVYNHMHYAQVVSITISYPLFTTIFAVVFLKERIGVHRIVALVIGFAGALVVVNPAAEEFNNYSLLAIGAITMWAAFDTFTNKVGKKESVKIQLLHLLIFMAAFSTLPASIISISNLPALDFHHMLIFIFLGAVVIIYMLSAVLAVADSEVNIVAPFYFTSLPIGSIIAYFIFDETIKTRSVIGACIIISSVIFIAYREYRAKKIAKDVQQSRLI